MGQILLLGACTAPLLAQAQNCPTGDNTNAQYILGAADGVASAMHWPTGLVWKRCPEGLAFSSGQCSGSMTSRNWNDWAASYLPKPFASQANWGIDAAYGQNLLESGGWRMAYTSELRTITYGCGDDPKVNRTVFPNQPPFNTYAQIVWSGSPATYMVGNYAPVVYFSNGNNNLTLSNRELPIRLVRGGQPFASLTSPAAEGAGPDNTATFPTFTLSASELSGQAWGGARITGDGSPAFQINGTGGWVQEAIVKSGDQITVRLTAPGTVGNSHTATFTLRSGQTTGTNDDASNGGNESTAMQQTSASFTVNAVPVAGVCGTAGGVATVAAPSANLCSAGTASAVDGSAAATFTWTCLGQQGGADSGQCSAPRQYAVTPSVGANGTISPDTVQNVTYNQPTSFTVTPATGYTVSIGGTCPAGSWSNHVYTTGQIVSDCTVSATFTQSTYDISTSVSGGGGTMICTPNPVPHGGSATCTATPAAGFNFASWGGACSGSGACTLSNVTAAQSVSAGFTAAPPPPPPPVITYTVTAASSPAAGGTTACTPSSVSSGGASTCTATANAGYRFTGWSGDCSGTGVTCTLTDITADRNVTAGFAAETWTIGTQAEPAAGGSVACDPSSVAHGETSTCTATANAGYRFTGWSGDCTGTEASCTLTDITAQRNVTANFAVETWTIVTQAEPAAGGSVVCDPSSVAHGETSTCTATANAGYRFTGWSGDCTGTEVTCTLSNITANRSVTAGFAPTLVLPEGPDSGEPLQLEMSGPEAWTLTQVSTAPVGSVGTPLPAGVTLPHGVVSLTLEQGEAGSGAIVMLAYPSALPAGTRYYKYGPTAANPVAHWYEYPHAVINGHTITLTLTDGGAGDSDLSENGVIVDPGGPAQVAPDVTPIPTLSQWATMLLAGLMGLLAFGRLRRLPHA